MVSSNSWKFCCHSLQVSSNTINHKAIYTPSSFLTFFFFLYFPIFVHFMFLFILSKGCIFSFLSLFPLPLFIHCMLLFIQSLGCIFSFFLIFYFLLLLLFPIFIHCMFLFIQSKAIYSLSPSFLPSPQFLFTACFSLSNQKGCIFPELNIPGQETNLWTLLISRLVSRIQFKRKQEPFFPIWKHAQSLVYFESIN